MKFAIAIRTCDRHPQKNFLGSTIKNLFEHGGAAATRSNRSESIGFKVVIGDGRGFDRIEWQNEFNSACDSSNATPLTNAGLTPNQNAGSAIQCAAMLDPEWVIFLEDDLDFCSEFLESVDLWLRDWARDDRRVYSLCCAFKQGNPFINPMPFWDMPAGVFFGTQGFIMRKDDASSFAQFLMDLDPIQVPTTLDFQLAHWLFQNHPNAPYITATCPSFVQHVGFESSIHNGRFHSYRSFDRGFKYLQAENPCIFSLDEASTPKRSQRLAAALKTILPKNKPVYDFGCGVGYYISELEKGGYLVHGFEGTPNIRSISDTRRITEQDLMCQMEFFPFQVPYGVNPTEGTDPNLLELHRTPMLPGSVMSIEVAEHIPNTHLVTYLSNVLGMCDGKAVISWALPGQGGLRHVSEANPEWVINFIQGSGEFDGKGHPFKFKYNHDESMFLRSEAGKDFHWFKDSIYVFDRTDFSSKPPTPAGLQEFWNHFLDLDLK